MPHYDVLIIGAGSGNMIITDEFADRRVAIVEKGPFGGTCLNRGCIPSKMLVLTADLANDASDGPRFGVRSRFDGVDWPAVRERVFGRTDEQAADGLEGREAQGCVDVLRGPARFTGPRELVVELADGPIEVGADQIVLATGSRPVVPDIPGLADADPYTSDTIMRIDALPARLAVIGGGDIGCELAHVFSALGVQVTQLESEDVLLSGQDRAVAELFTRLAARQWEVRTDTDIQRVVRDEGGVHLDLGATARSTQTRCSSSPAGARTATCSDSTEPVSRPTSTA